MTPASAKKIILNLIRPKMIVAEVGRGRYFIGYQRGRGIIHVADTMYYTNIHEAHDMAEKMEEALINGDLIL